MMNPYLQVALGAAIGGVMRLAVFRALPTSWAAVGVPTLVVNVLGSLAMGLGFALLVQRGVGAYAPLMLTGVLGGFTTFSAFSLDVVAMWERGQGVAALCYIAASVVLSIVALVAGLAIGKGLSA